jgi:hypothetical protein
MSESGVFERISESAFKKSCFRVILTNSPV